MLRCSTKYLLNRSCSWHFPTVSYNEWKLKSWYCDYIEHWIVWYTKEIADLTTLPSKIGQRNDTFQQWMEMLWSKKISTATHLLSSSSVISEAEWDLLKPASLSSWIGVVTLSGPPINWFVHGTVGMLSHEDPEETTMAGEWVKLGWKTKDN